MIVITNPISVENEIHTIHSLFAQGLELLHVRKPHFSEPEMKIFLSSIALEFRPQLVLHQYHLLAFEFGIAKLHFSQKARPIISEFQNPVGCKIELTSTSTHTIKEFNTLAPHFDCAFLSPIYPSISKPNYVPSTNHFTTLHDRTNFSTKLIALGGISPKNIQQTLDNGFDAVAFLGAIWHHTHPIENFKKCQKIVLSYSL